MKSYIERIAANRSPLIDEDLRWRRFIQDHRDPLMVSSVVIKIDPNIMNTFRFRPRELIGVLGISTDLEYIIRYLNKLETNDEWVNLTSLIIPSASAVSLLRAQYESYISEYEKSPEAVF